MKTLFSVAVAIATACILFGPRPAQAWHQTGHMTVALIAYRQLDEKEQQKIQDVLKKHPHYGIFLSAGVPADANLDEWVVMQAAVWPDWIKNPTSISDKSTRTKIKQNFGHSDWHYANKAIKVTDGASPDEEKQIEANSAKERGDIAVQLPQLIAGFKGQNDVDLVKLVWASTHAKPSINEDEARAIALCWILHLTGDAHQPLHATSLYSKDALKGDAGGNDLIIRWGNRATDLHSIWDAMGRDELKGSQDSQYAVVDVLTRDLLSRIKPTPQELKVTSLDSWIEESFQLAQTKAYNVRGQFLPGVFVRFGEHRPHAADLDMLPDGYRQVVQQVADKQVTLAGYRLGTSLKDLTK